MRDLSKQIREWIHPLMVHESLRKLAHLTNVPESAIGVGQDHVPNLYIKRSANIEIESHSVDPDRILEFDVLRWLLLLGKLQVKLVELVKINLAPEGFKSGVCRALYQAYLDCYAAGISCDLLNIATALEDSEAQRALSEILQKRVNRERGELHLEESIQKMLDRNWMEKRELVRIKIQDGQCSDDEAMELMKVFEELKRNPPKLIRN